MPSEPQPKGTYTLDLKHPALHLSVLPDAGLYVHRFPRGTAVPSAFLDAGDAFVSVTRTKDEVSVVADKAATEAALGKAEQLGGAWAALKIAGPLEHHMVGVLSQLSQVLKDAKISIFAISTWDTDYILVTRDKLAGAKAELLEAGWVFD
ncbi:hypothetical protein VHUM_00948 [Vanrija humicola]|uniref:CASTOR ACT domain-containing protein n=1 Tax=Vanrija humicola TaxID=5417 RepID=A0A7D8V989_VANHU|nr:hypothetical protein VHUM_00948 [Vanrija humicola]